MSDLRGRGATEPRAVVGGLAKFEESGKSTPRFCSELQISARTFAWWRWQLRDERRREAPVRKSVRLIAVDVTPPAFASRSADAGVRIAFAGVEVHVAVGTDVEYVGALVGALRSRG